MGFVIFFFFFFFFFHKFKLHWPMLSAIVQNTGFQPLILDYSVPSVKFHSLIEIIV